MNRLVTLRQSEPDRPTPALTLDPSPSGEGDSIRSLSGDSGTSGFAGNWFAVPMRGLVIAALALVVFAWQGPLCAQDRAMPVSARAVVEAAIAKMKPSLVRIHVVSTEYREGRELKMQAVGSGAIISKDGYLVTNHHVAGHGARMVCTLSDREEIDAELVGTDPLTDISVLKLKPKKPREFVAATFGDSSKLLVGDSVLAMGSPMALSQSVTLGIISNVEMTMPRLFGTLGRFRLDGEDVGSLIRWVAHDAAIYGGNSGGPLVNLDGQIVGINEIRFGLSGAIPGNIARQVADELIAHGRVKRSWLGFDAQPLFKNSAEQRGLLVGGVVSDSPASRAGMKAGDVLVRLAGKETHVRYDEEMPEFMRLATSLPIGQEVPAVVLRDGKERTLTLVPVERGELNAEQEELKAWGLTVRNLSFLTAREMKRTNQEGVLVTSVRPGGPAGEAKPALDVHDVLTAVNGKPVKNMQELIELTAKLTHDQTEPVPVLATFERESMRYLTVVKVGVQELRDPGLEVSKAWLPIETHVISRDIARQLGNPDLKGFYVTKIYPNSTAEKAGLHTGDFITAVDGEKLAASGPEHEEEFAALMRQYDIGARVNLSVLRDGSPMKITAELARSPKLRREMKKYRNDDFEFTVRDIAFFDEAEEQWPTDQKGVLVEEVKSGSWAELGSLYTGDLIVEVDGHAISNVEDLKSRMEEVAKEKKEFVRMKVVRGIHTAYLEIEPSWNAPKTRGL
jgi:serine protease Do